MTKSPQFEKFKVRKKLAFQESLLWGVESVIYIVGGFFSGFMLRQTNNLIFLAMFVLILVIRFQWYRIEETTRKVRLI